MPTLIACTRVSTIKPQSRKKAPEDLAVVVSYPLYSHHTHSHHTSDNNNTLMIIKTIAAFHMPCDVQGV